MNTEDLAEEDLDSMLEECSTLYEAVSTLWRDRRFRRLNCLISNFIFFSLPVFWTKVV